MALSVADFRIDYPQFASATEYPDATITRALNRAALRINEGLANAVADGYYDEGQGLLAAHFLALGAIANASQGSNTGGLAGAAITGHASIQFAQTPVTSQGKNSGYGQTRYGVEFLEWLSLVVVPVRIY